MDIITTAANNYIHVFSGYVNTFLLWGKGLFFSLLSIQLVWMTLWYAFDRHALAETLPAFLKRFFVITFFYTIMIHPAWLGSILHTAQRMGNTLVHAPIDPSSIIAQGIGLGNQLLIPVTKSSFMTMGLGLLIIAVVYLVVLFVFISIALDLALTLIITTALIALSTFFLGFAALGATSQIARQTLDVILANCVKLLGIYCVVAAGSQTITAVSMAVPTEITSFDPYAWIVAVALLFWLLAKNLPNQLAKIISGAILETHGADATALTMAATNLSSAAVSVSKTAASLLQGPTQLAGSTAYNALQHFKKASMETGPAIGIAAGVGGSLKDLGQAVYSNLSEHTHNMASKFVGGSGSPHPIQSVPSRMYQAAKEVQARTGEKL